MSLATILWIMIDNPAPRRVIDAVPQCVFGVTNSCNFFSNSLNGSLDTSICLDCDVKHFIEFPKSKNRLKYFLLAESTK